MQPDNGKDMKTQQAFDSLSGNGKSEDGKPSISAAMVSSEFHKFLADIDDLVKETTSLSGEELEKAREDIRSRIEAAKQSMGGFGISIGERAKKSASYTNHYAHKNPWPVIGLSALSGVLLGYLITRRS